MTDSDDDNEMHEAMALVAIAIVRAEVASRHASAAAIEADAYATILTTRTNCGALVAMLRTAADLIEEDHDALMRRETLVAAEGGRAHR